MHVARWPDRLSNQSNRRSHLRLGKLNPLSKCSDPRRQCDRCNPPLSYDDLLEEQYEASSQAIWAPGQEISPGIDRLVLFRSRIVQ